MSSSDQTFLKKLLETFKAEAKEHLTAITDGLMVLEESRESGASPEVVETIFREAHSLKGAARSVNLGEVESLCQSLEGVFAQLRSGRLELSPTLFDTVHAALDLLNELTGNLEAKGGTRVSDMLRGLERLRSPGLASSRSGEAPPETLPREPTSQPPADLVPKATTASKASPPPESGDTEAAPDPASREDVLPAGRNSDLETVRVSTRKLESIIRQANELVPAQAALKHAHGRLDSLRERIGRVVHWSDRWSHQFREWSRQQERFESGQASSERAARVTQLGELAERIQMTMAELDREALALTDDYGRYHRQLGTMIDGLATEARDVLLVHFSSGLELLPKMVRDLAHAQQKEATLTVRGGSIQIDRRILQMLKDPLIHLIRNGIDHGIELPTQRERLGKNRRGTISLGISRYDSKRVEVAVSDDGRGMDREAIRKAAVRHKLLSAAEARELDDATILTQAFRSGLSTMPIISDLSGRGLGLAIVQEKIDALGGFVSVETEPDQGSTFRLVVPVTYSTLSGVIVRVGDQRFVVPSLSLEQVLRLPKSEIRTVRNRETIRYHGRAVSLVHLGDLLGMAGRGSQADDNDQVSLLILNAGEKSVAVQVDEVLFEQEVLLKDLGRPLTRVRNCSGSAILGSGEPVVVLNVNDLIHSLAGLRPAPSARSDSQEAVAARRPTALVVEDSITSRMMLKNILESAGYEVQVAVDGAAGFALLGSEKVDVVVSDIEMPRMNGFELVTRIRGTKKLADLPVVLVTALDSRADRERGIEVGANAYLVKSSFDQSNLLEVLKRLV